MISMYKCLSFFIFIVFNFIRILKDFINVSDIEVRRWKVSFLIIFIYVLKVFYYSEWGMKCDLRSCVFLY